MLNPDKHIGKDINQFRLDEFIGQGAMGVVYKAFDNILQRTVALKLIPKGLEANTLAMAEARKRLIQEAQAAGRLVHPNIVTIHSYGETDEFQYICMEYIVGQNLAQLLAEKKTLPVEEAIGIIEQVLLALEVAHGEQIVHRDIKPANIMILPDKRIKVMDFGIAKIPTLTATTTGTVLGTPYYMSPEQISGQKVSILSDIFSVGAVCYQILTGERPFEGETTITVAYKIVQVEPVPLKILNVHIPQDVENICKKALAKDPALRYQTPTEMIKDIRIFMDKRRAAKHSSAEATIKTKVTSPAPKPLELKEGDKTVVSVEKLMVEPVEPKAQSAEEEVKPVKIELKLPEAEVKPPKVEQKKPEPPPSTPPPKKEPPPPPKPSAPKASPTPGKGGGSASRTIAIAVGLCLVTIIGVLVFRHQKTGVQYAGKPPTAVQPVTPQIRPPEQKSYSQLDSLVLQAKDQIQSNPASARKLLDKALAINPNHFEATLQMARLLTFQQDFQPAIAFYLKAQQLNSQVPEISYNLGFIYMNQGNYDQAIYYYEMCRGLFPSYQDEVLTNLGYCHLRKKNFKQARILFRKALSLNPQNTIAKNYLKSLGR
jgi:serine/threonine protein kinase/cytochrome c-type biogenesis protein CcmH/NrfG